MTALRFALAVGLTSGLALACGGGSTESDAQGVIDITNLTYRVCDNPSYLGGFELALHDGYASLQGQVFDKPSPLQFVDVIQTDGDCKLLKTPTQVCSPTCSGGQLCFPGGQCQAAPVAQDLGEVAVEGLADAVSMTARAPANFYNFTGTLAAVPFGPAQGLRLSSGTGTLLGVGIDPLTTTMTSVPVQTGQPVALTWTVPTATTVAKIKLRLNVNGHGLVGSQIECTVADTGSFMIPEPLVTALVADGLSGFPTLSMTRKSSDVLQSTSPAGCMEFVVESAKVLNVEIPGLQSCDGDEDCKAPETCQGDLTCG